MCVQVCGADTPYLSPEKLQEVHIKSKKESIDVFNNTPKLGGEEVSKKYCSELESKIEDSYESFVKRNESKHILNAYRTPAVLGMVMVLSYLVSSILDTLGVESLSQTAIFGLYIPIILLILWMYIRYSGEFRELGQMIDNITSTVWEQVRPVEETERLHSYWIIMHSYWIIMHSYWIIMHSYWLNYALVSGIKPAYPITTGKLV